MGLPRLSVVLSLVLACFAEVTTAVGDDALPADTVKRLKDATVYVKTKIGPLEMSGSGFVIETTGNTALIATNQHVIAKPKELRPGSYIPGLRGRDQLALTAMQTALARAEPEVTIVFNSGSPNEQAIQSEILGGIEEPDLAIVKVTGIKTAPKPIAFRNIGEPIETMGLYILGFPFGDALSTNKGNPAITIGKGSVSSVRKDAAGKLAVVQIDGALNPGNSGGPIVDMKGNLVGIAVQTIQGSSIGLAIPPAELEGVLEGRIGNPVIQVSASTNGAAPAYEIVIPVVDPMKKLKSVSVRYVEGSAPIDNSKTGQPQLQSAPGSQSLNLPIVDRAARAALPLAATSGAPKARDVTLQASFVSGQGKTVHLDPQVLHVMPPVVVNTTVKREGNSTTITQTQRSGGRTIERKTTITRGKSTAKRKAPEKRAANGDKELASAAGNDSAEKVEKEEKSASESSDAKSGDATKVAWTNKIANMKKIPDEEVVGKIDGLSFTPDDVVLQHGNLIFTKAPGLRGSNPEAELKIIMFIPHDQDVSGQKLVVNGRIRAGDPHIHMSAMRKEDRHPRSDFFHQYLLILEFGDYDAESRVQPGKLFICLPDRGKSFLAGSFEARVE